MPVGDRSDGVDELVGVGVLEQEAARAGPQGVEDVVVAVEGGEDEYLGQVGLDDLAGGRDAVEDRHLHVHEHDVRAQLLCCVDCLAPVGRLADDLDVRFDSQDHREPAPDQVLVVDEQHSDRRGVHSGFRAGRARRSTEGVLGAAHQGEAHPDPVATGRPRPDLAGAAVGGEALADAERAQAGAARAAPWATVVEDLGLGIPLAHPDHHAGVGRGGMPPDVGQRLLDGAVDGQADPGGTRRFRPPRPRRCS